MLKRIVLAGFGLVMLFFLSCRLNQEPKPVSLTKYHTDGDAAQLLKSENPAAVNIVILGDGYEKKDLQAGGKFDVRAKAVVDFLFDTAPFNSYKTYFNVYQVYAQSADDMPGINAPNSNTKFNTSYAPGTQLFMLQQV